MLAQNAQQMLSLGMAMRQAAYNTFTNMLVRWILILCLQYCAVKGITSFHVVVLFVFLWTPGTDLGEAGNVY